MSTMSGRTKMFRRNSFFTPTENEVEYQEGVRRHALRIEKPTQEKGINLDQVAEVVQDALDERDPGS